jgi:hypothetical protein
MISDKEYKSLTTFAKQYLKGKPHLQPEDFVNDILLQILEDGAKFSVSDAIKRIKNHQGIKERPISKMGKDFGASETERVCKDCREVLPVAMFQMLKLKHCMALASYCNPCKAKRNNKWRLESGMGKAYGAKYRKTTWVKEMEHLSDKYITKIIIDGSYRAIKKGLTTREEIKQMLSTPKGKILIKKTRERKLEERKKKSKTIIGGSD